MFSIRPDLRFPPIMAQREIPIPKQSRISNSALQFKEATSQTTKHYLLFVLIFVFISKQRWSIDMEQSIDLYTVNNNNKKGKS